MKKLFLHCIFIGFNFFVLSFEARSSNLGQQSMSESERLFNERQRKSIVSLMPVETMFPNEHVRSLAKAAGRGNVNLIDQIVSEGIDVNSLGSGNSTPLYWAMKKNSLIGFRKLLELGANPNAIFSDGGAIMHSAAKNEDERFLALALRSGGDPNLIADGLGESVLFQTIGIFGEIGKTSIIDMLLDAGADVNMRRANGDTPVIVAAKTGRFDIVYRLLQGKADPNIKSFDGQNLTTITIKMKGMLDPEHELYDWLNKVEKQFLVGG
ncbi:MAG: ankyrin repeat domain-containing protein [Colwellia sp.]